METIFQSLSTILYSRWIKLHVSVKNEKPSFFPSYPDHFNLGIDNTDHAPTIYTLCYSWLMLHLIIFGNTAHTVGLLAARDQSLTNTPTWRHKTFSRKRHPWPRGIRNCNPNLNLIILIWNFNIYSFSNVRNNSLTNTFFMEQQPLVSYGLLIKRLHVTFRHTTLGRSTLEEWSAWRIL
jgi:hypothetical protein